MDIHFLKICEWLGDNLQWVAHVLHLLWAEVLTAFDLDYVFKDVCVVNSLWRESCFSLEQKTSMLTIKDSDFLSSGFLSCNAAHGVCRCHLALFELHGVPGAVEWHKRMLLLGLLLLLWVTKFFVSDPRVSCPLPASMKQWQCHSLASK